MMMNWHSCVWMPRPTTCFVCASMDIETEVVKGPIYVGDIALKVLKILHIDMEVIASMQCTSEMIPESVYVGDFKLEFDEMISISM